VLSPDKNPDIVGMVFCKNTLKFLDLKTLLE
jgi:hypothetical protein